MELIQGIYCIKNKINNEIYIGSSIHIYKRRNRHFSELRNNKHKNYKLQRLYNLHGEESFLFYLIESVDIKENLISREQYYIDNLKPQININLIANSSLGVKRSEETKEKIRQANLGLKHHEWRNKIKSEAMSGDKNWTKTKGFSEESKLKMSESQKKLYESGYISPKLNKEVSIETKEKMSKSRKKLFENGYVHPRLKKVNQYSLENEFIKTWESLSEVEKELGISRTAICNCLNGLSKKSNNYIWKYEEE